MSSSTLLSIGFAVGFLAWAILELGRRMIAPLINRLRHPCRNGHAWVHRGGRNAGCSRDCCCSIPVYECSRCPACDYGENAEAEATIEACERAQDVRACTCQFGYEEIDGIGYRAMDCPVHGEENPERDEE